MLSENSKVKNVQYLHWALQIFAYQYYYVAHAGGEESMSG